MWDVNPKNINLWFSKSNVLTCLNKIIISSLISFDVSSVASELSPTFPSEVSDDSSSSSEGIPLVDISSVSNAGKTNNSVPLTVITVCSKINGSFSIFPLISPWIVTLESTTSPIVNIITIQLG